MPLTYLHDRIFLCLDKIISTNGGGIDLCLSGLGKIKKWSFKTGGLLKEVKFI
jgi:hypothetical protein